MRHWKFCPRSKCVLAQKIIAVDISEEAIKKAKKRSEEVNKNIDFKVDNCENLSLNSNSFDIIYGVGILHHLDLKKSSERNRRS